MTREIDLTERQAPARPCHSAAHDAAMVRIRQLLESFTVPRQARWWTGLKPAERATLMRHAGLDPERGRLRWVQLDVEQRQGILQAAERAASWARQLLEGIA